MFKIRTHFRIGLVFLVLPVFFGCEKDNATKLLGKWKISQNNYLITLREDRTIMDIYNQPWQGSFVLGEETYQAEDFYLEVSNVFGNYILASESIGIYMHFFTGSIIIGTNSNEYTFTGGYELSMKDGHVSAEGIAYDPYSNPMESVNFSFDLQGQELLMHQNREYRFPDLYYFMKNPIWEITFEDNGKISGGVLDLDVILLFSGNWDVSKDDQLHLNWYCGDLMLTVDNEYSFTVSHSDTLRLTEKYSTITTFEYSDHIPVEIIKQIKYESVFLKDSK